jgi:hypothetical protein
MTFICVDCMRIFSLWKFQKLNINKVRSRNSVKIWFNFGIRTTNQINTCAQQKVKICYVSEDLES